jgi:hypothetical protein
VGTGTPQSCTERAFEAALAERSVSFNCGPAPVTITLTGEKTITAATAIDGGGRVTLSGGGAVRIFTVTYGAGLDLRNLTIADGRGDLGGGIVNAGTLALTNCTLNDNSADGSSYNGAGGGISNRGTATLTNCTLSGNSATEGGGISGPAFATLRNTIVANSPSGGDCTYGQINHGSHNLIEDATNSCGLTNGVNGNLVGVDPMLGPLANNGGPMRTIALLPGSPAVNAGDADVCANPPVNGVDQRGYVRPGTGAANCSIGAFEYNAPGPLGTCVGDCANDGQVTVDELLTMVSIALGTASMSACDVGDPNNDDQITVDEILTAVNNALDGCGA